MGLDVPWIRAGGAAVASLLAVGAVAVFGSDQGHPAHNVRLLSGMAWLASSTVGQITLMDGSTAEVAAQLAVSSAGSAVEIVQAGTDAYAVDRSGGTVRRINGATFDLTQPQSPIPDARSGLTAFAGPDVLYILDSQRGVYVEADPKTLAPRNEPQSLAAQLGEGTASLDSAGRLWLVDNASGDLTSIDHGRRRTVKGVTKPGKNILAMAQGRPVIVHAAEREVITIDPDTGTADKTLSVDLRSNDTVQVSGSAQAGRVYVVASRGVLSICDLTANSCEHTIPLAAESRLGAAVEAANRVFVPDHTTGQVWIIDLADGKVIARPQVLKPAGPFQLLAQDGVVFYNDTKTERAGVVRLDGTVVSAAKYDVSDPRKGVTTPVANVPSAPVPPSGNPSRPPVSGQQPTEPARPSHNPGNPTQPTQPAPRTDPADPAGPPDPGQPTQPTDPTPDPTPDPKPVPKLLITANNPSPTAEETVTFGVKAEDGQALSNARWTFNGTGADAGTGTGAPVTHTWAKAGGPFMITVQAEIPDGRTAVGSTNVTVGSAPTLPVTVTASQNGRVTSSDGAIACPGRCSADVDRRKSITLTAAPSAGFKFDGWGGAFVCGNAPQCTLNMQNRTEGFQMTASFRVRKDPTFLTLEIRSINNAAGRIMVRGGTTGECASTGGPKSCTFKVEDPDDAVQISGEADPGWEFVGWTSGPCHTNTPNDCLFNVFQSATQVGTFQKRKGGFVWLLPLTGLAMPRGRRRRPPDDRV